MRSTKVVEHDLPCHGSVGMCTRLGLRMASVAKMRGRFLFECHILELFAVPLCKCDCYY